MASQCVAVASGVACPLRCIQCAVLCNYCGIVHIMRSISFPGGEWAACVKGPGVYYAVLAVRVSCVWGPIVLRWGVVWCCESTPRQSGLTRHLKPQSPKCGSVSTYTHAHAHTLHMAYGVFNNAQRGRRTRTTTKVRRELQGKLQVGYLHCIGLTTVPPVDLATACQSSTSSMWHCTSTRSIAARYSQARTAM